MKCPRCDRELEEVDVNGVKVDACHHGCGGIWFDNFELRKMDEPEESAGWLLENMAPDLTLEVDFAKQIDCPRCAGIHLMRQSYPPKPQLKTDKCPSCGGIWLDFGELFEIRASNTSEGANAVQKLAAGELLRGIIKY